LWLPSRVCSVHEMQRAAMSSMSVQVAPGISGALLAGPEGPTSVTWLQNGLHFVVIGPPGSFSSKLAIAVARATAAAQGTS
jgi:hypothetical protein